MKRWPARLAGGTDRRFLAASAGVILLAVVLRFVNLGGGLPALTAADEPVVMDRARGLLAGRPPTDFDWPPGSMYFLAAMLRLVRWGWPSALTAAEGPYLFARVVFAAVGVATVAAAIAVGYRLADEGRRRSTALATGLLMAVSFLSVRLSRQVHPDHLQLLAVLLGFLAVLRFDASRRMRWLMAAGALAGLAAATKYVGGVVVLPASVAVLWHPAAWRTRLAQLGALGGSVVAGVAAGAPLIFGQAGDVWAGVAFQFDHQAGGHLGYDQLAPSWGFHLVHSLPGNWGWPVTVLACTGLGLAAYRGSRAQRLGALLALALFAVLGGSRVRFPHYLIPVLPLLAAFAAVAAGRLVAAVRGRVAATAITMAVAVSVVPALLDDLRVVRTAAAVDTRTIAAETVAALPGPVLAERYATPLDGGSLGEQPRAAECGCFVAVSSYMEQRYRREPRRYASQVAVYDALRQRGRVVAVVAPGRALRYDWDLLPEWGLRRVPLLGAVGRTGPTITILDLRRRG